MADKRHQFSPWRYLLGITAALVAMAWLWVLLLFPDGLKDGHGYNQLFWLVILSGFHVILGFVLLAASALAVVRVRLAVLVVSAPIFHVAGAPFEVPWCLVLFVPPSVAIVIAAALEVIGDRMRA